MFNVFAGLEQGSYSNEKSEWISEDPKVRLYWASCPYYPRIVSAYYLISFPQFYVSSRRGIITWDGRFRAPFLSNCEHRNPRSMLPYERRHVLSDDQISYNFANLSATMITTCLRVCMHRITAVFFFGFSPVSRGMYWQWLSSLKYAMHWCERDAGQYYSYSEPKYPSHLILFHLCPLA